MPPPGGFASINIERTFARPLIRQGIWALIGVALTFNGFHLCCEWKKRWRVLKLEQVEHFIAASPFLLAEQERKFLIHLRSLREEERELMKDHPGWKVGTLYGERVYKTLPKDELPPINPFEYTAHRFFGEFNDHVVTPDLHQ